MSARRIIITAAGSGTGREIADLCQYLASDAAKFISGQAILLDGHAETYHSE